VFCRIWSGCNAACERTRNNGDITESRNATPLDAMPPLALVVMIVSILLEIRA
jgi:hypothetical protein